MTLRWQHDLAGIDWKALSELYRIAPLGEKSAADLAVCFSNSMFRCFVFDGALLVGAGRAVADGIDCSYICDVAVHPAYQGRGLGKEIIGKLRTFSAGHRKIILYANPGKEPFYRKLGFLPMKTAMAIFRDREHAIRTGLVEDA
jgi:ribosomal protein S18 acetylase RimI-like enzyme